MSLNDEERITIVELEMEKAKKLKKNLHIKKFLPNFAATKVKMTMIATMAYNNWWWRSRM